MEKKKAHYNLDEIKNLINNGHVIITNAASLNARKDFNLSKREIIRHILELETIDLYKSMTSHYDSKLWQDVYHKKINRIQIAYIKLQILNKNSVVVQFKEK